MQFVERSFRLEAPTGLGRKPRPDLIGPLFTHLPETLQDAVRMGFLHSSRARGRVAHSLKAAAQVRYVGHEADGEHATVLHFEVARFGDAAAGLFQQTTLWDEGPTPDQTPFELLGAALRDVESLRKDSSRYDRGLLKRIGSYSRLLNQGLNRIVLPDAELPAPARIDAAVVAAAAELSAATPPPRRVRVTGRLDLMGASEALLKLELRPGVLVTTVWEGSLPIEQLYEYFNHQVVVEGEGVFRASGSLLRIDADAVAPASRHDEFFREVPEAMPAHADYAVLAHLRPQERSVYKQVLGSIPGEESDDDFTAAVQELS